MMRFMREYVSLETQLATAFNNQVRIALSDHDNLCEIVMSVTIVPNEGAYACAKAEFDVRFDDEDNYAPRVRSKTDLYHPNIGLSYDDGFVCLNILTEESWGDKTLEDLVQGLLFLFYNPNPESIYNGLYRDYDSDAEIRRSLLGEETYEGIEFEFKRNLYNPETFEPLTDDEVEAYRNGDYPRKKHVDADETTVMDGADAAVEAAPAPDLGADATADAATATPTTTAEAPAASATAEATTTAETSTSTTETTATTTDPPALLAIMAPATVLTPETALDDSAVALDAPETAAPTSTAVAIAVAIAVTAADDTFDDNSSTSANEASTPVEADNAEEIEGKTVQVNDDDDEGIAQSDDSSCSPPASLTTTATTPSTAYPAQGLLSVTTTLLMQLGTSAHSKWVTLRRSISEYSQNVTSLTKFARTRPHSAHTTNADNDNDNDNDNTDVISNNADVQAAFIPVEVSSA